MTLTGPGRTPRWIVLAFLLASFVWAPVIAVSFTEPPTPLLAAVFLGGLALLGSALLLVLLDVVTPTSNPAARRWKVTVLVVLTMGLWAPMFSWAEPGEQPWAWLSGFVVAACGLVGWRSGVVATGVLGGAAVAGALLFDRAVLPNVVTTLGVALGVWAMCQALVWLHRLWWSAQDGREAQARLAVAEERLRVGRELHDVLGRRLAVIALKAERAADLAAQDPDGAAGESRSIRELAAGALREARRTIHGEAVTDLPAQLRSADLVLRSAGVTTTVDADPRTLSTLPPPLAGLFATVVREAVTNVLRHSDARLASIRVVARGPVTALSVENDGVRSAARSDSTGGTGLAGLAARCGALGADLVSGPEQGGRFVVRVRHPAPSGRS
ncbi:sensor histidine kinase [Cellulosimicrobium sp. NPDC057862]|uniref:sensor histidine kinase n=1 Tax=Cellulosimicrobium sp. NPDC057862 TaxID=3346266 RepID=UPI00366FF503